MKYSNIKKGVFIDRPNRFIAHVRIDGFIETVHVKNTGRCAELLKEGTVVYVQDSMNPGRKTRWDLIAVEKGRRMVNMDSQVPNKAVKEWLEAGNLFRDVTIIRPEYTYGNSRIDLYVEAEGRRILIEVKGVTLEEDGIVRFPDAPSQRAVKHVTELRQAAEDGYEAYIFFVIQMKGVRYFTPNTDTHPQFAEALEEAAKAGVKLLAYDCEVTQESIVVSQEVPVVLNASGLLKAHTDIFADDIIEWYRKNKRQLPWRDTKDAYRIWVSEIMLQQTRVEAVKPYYARFLKELPDVKALAQAEEDKLLKLWEGLGYYNRVRNMQKAARQIVIDYHGEFPDTYEEICSLTGIGSYTAGAISSFAYNLAQPAVDGNVLRVITRITGDDRDIMKQGTRKSIEERLKKVIPKHAPGDFNQGLIELGALVCVPNAEPGCGKCPAFMYCEARKQNRTGELPVRKKPKKRRIEKHTILVFRDHDKIAISKRSGRGLLAGLYELPGVEGHLTPDEVTAYCKDIGLMPIQIRSLGEAKHIFSHVEWHMTGYAVLVDELEKINKKEYLFVRPEEIKETYPIPSAFESYMQTVK
ncbi:MAG: DNA/RNA nuclease SfsA [Dorea sp.]|nr:DNA/RNA nuclease SfsA [Dorea sp.]